MPHFQIPKNRWVKPWFHFIQLNELSMGWKIPRRKYPDPYDLQTTDLGADVLWNQKRSVWQLLQYFLSSVMPSIIIVQI